MLAPGVANVGEWHVKVTLTRERRPLEVFVDCARSVASVVRVGSIRQIELTDSLMTVVDGESAVDDRGPKSERLTGKGFGEKEQSTFDVDVAATVHGSNQVRRVVFDRLQLLREGSSAHDITVSGNSHPESGVGSFVVVDLTPAVEGRLHQLMRIEPAGAEQFGLERAMKAFVLAESLGVKRPRMKRSNAEPDQPDGKLGVGMS